MSATLPSVTLKAPSSTFGRSTLRAPRDGGLSGLALMMSFVGTMTTTLTCTLGVVLAMLLISSRHGSASAGWIMLGLVTSCVRAAMHRNAGTTLLSRPDNRPLGGVYRYIVASAIHTIALTTWCALSWPLPLTVGLALLCVAWPLSLLVMLRLPRFRSFAVAVPTSEDRGFEGASILMTLFGSAGVALILLAIAYSLGLPERHTADASRHLALYVVAPVLAVRSAMQLGVGVFGMRNANTEQMARMAKSYVSVALVGLGLATLAMFVLVMLDRVDGSSMIAFLVFGGLLLIGPSTIQRFFAPERLLSRNDVPDLLTTRAPDRGISTWGWALLGLSAMTLAFALPMTIWSGNVSNQLSNALPIATRGVLSTPLPLCILIVAGLQLVVAIALINVHARHRMMTLIYGGVALTLAFTVAHAPTLVDAVIHFDDSKLVEDSGLIVLVVLANLVLLPLISLFVVLRPSVQRV